MLSTATTVMPPLSLKLRQLLAPELQLRKKLISLISTSSAVLSSRQLKVIDPVRSMVLSVR